LGISPTGEGQEGWGRGGGGKFEGAPMPPTSGGGAISNSETVCTKEYLREYYVSFKHDKVTCVYKYEKKIHNSTYML
jgi:hypothetical protein